MRVLHLLVAGGVGGIEVLMKDFALYSMHDNHFLFAWSGGKIAEEIQKNGSKVTILNKEKQGSVYVLKTILEICKEDKIEVVLVHHEAPLLRGALCLIKVFFPSIRLISYVHRNAEDMCGYGVEISWIKKLIYNLSFLVSDEIIAISEFVRESIINTFCVDKKKVKVIYNGVDIKKYYPVALKKEKMLNLIYVGRLVEEKGVQIILNSLARLSEDIEYHLKIVGDGVYRKELQKCANQLGIGENVSFLGSRRDVAELLQMSDVFIHVPMVDEGFGITVIEAMACGKICVCSKSGALLEIIQEKQNGFFVNKNDIQALCTCLKEIANLTKIEIDSIKKNAIKRANDFSTKNFVDNLDCLIG